MAGVYSDELSKCLVESSTAADRAGLVRWMFIALGSNPAVSQMVKITDADRDGASRTMGALLTKLMTDTCKDKASKALKYEGGAAIKASFEFLGQVASQDLFSDPHVANVMADVNKYVDAKKLSELTKQQGP